MTSAFYLMDTDFGDLAYAIAILIMGGASALVGHFRKKKKQAEFEEGIKKRSRRQPQAKPRGKTLEEWVEAILPEEVKSARRPKAPVAERPGVGPPAARRVEPAGPPQMESPLVRPGRPAPPKPPSARPVTPPPRLVREAARTGERAPQPSACDLRAAKRAWYLPSRCTKDELRKAIIMNEVLGKPIALREPVDF